MASTRCKHLKVPPTASGRIIVRKDHCYRCTCPIPDMPQLPVSVTSAYGFAPVTERSKARVSADQCAKCPLFEAAQ